MLAPFAVKMSDLSPLRGLDAASDAASARPRPRGSPTKEVAEALGISVKTAMTHREHVMEKLGLHNRTELVRFALKKGVIRVEP